MGHTYNKIYTYVIYLKFNLTVYLYFYFLNLATPRVAQAWAVDSLALSPRTLFLI